MPYTLDWYYRDQVIITRFTEPITPDDIMKFDHEIIVMIDSSKAKLVHCIMDATGLAKLPAPKEFRNMKWTAHPKGGWSVMFGLRGVMIFIGSIISQMLRHRWRPLKTEHDCVLFLKEIDPTLADMKLPVEAAKAS